MSGTEPSPGRFAPPPAFRLEEERTEAGTAVLVLAGEIDLSTSGRFRAALDAARQGGANGIVVDLSDVTFVDSTMLRELLRAHGDCGENGVRFALAAPGPPVRRLLELTGTDAVLSLHDERQSAIEFVAGP